MYIDKAYLSLVLDKRVQKSDNSYPVCLRITHKRKYRIYRTGEYLTESDFSRVMGDRPRGEYKELRGVLDMRLAHARSIADSMTEFTFDKLKEQLFTPTDAKNEADLFPLFRDYIKGLKKNGQEGTAISYGNAYASFFKFTKGRVNINRITPQFLQRYEAWMTGRGRSDTTVGIYVRSLRAVINQAVENGVMKPERYPFGRKGYTPPQGNNTKKALTIEDVRKLAAYEPETESAGMYRDFWLLSYLCNGANIYDLLVLKRENIQNGVIVFNRQKTKRKARGKHIVITYSAQVRAIVERWGDPGSEGFIFPVMDSGYSERERLIKAKYFIKNINKYINRIAENVGINQHITTYTARHTYATVMKRAGVPISFISDSLGHSDIRVTEAYLGSFEDGYRAEVSKFLTDW